LGEPFARISGRVPKTKQNTTQISQAKGAEIIKVRKDPASRFVGPTQQLFVTNGSALFSVERCPEPRQKGQMHDAEKAKW